MTGTLALVTGPTGEPITLEDAKAFARVTGQDDDPILDALIVTARQYFDGRDGWFGRALLTQTWDLMLSRFPCEADEPYDWQFGIRVPLPPLQSVSSVSYVDVDGNPQVLSPTAYVVDTKKEPGRITPAYGTSWPATRSIPNSVTVRFMAGYGTAKDVPSEIKAWLKQAVAYLYSNREAGQLPGAFFWSIAKYKVSWGC